MLRHSVPHYQREIKIKQNEILNITLHQVTIELTTSRVFSHTLSPWATTGPLLLLGTYANSPIGCIVEATPLHILLAKCSVISSRYDN